MTRPADATTVDAFLGGRFHAVQRGQGEHRSGLEAILLSAAVGSDFAGTAVDLGAGSGVAGMAIAVRAPASRVVLVERDEDSVGAARLSLALPENAVFASRVSILEADIMAPEGERVAAGLERSFADLVVTNPPFRRPESGTQSPVPGRKDAHVLGDGALETWVRTGTSILKSTGRMTVIFRADGLTELLTALTGRFGNITVLPIHPRTGSAAKRVLVTAEKGSRAFERILPGLVLHADAGHAYRDDVDQILRGRASLAEVQPGWTV